MKYSKFPNRQVYFIYGNGIESGSSMNRNKEKRENDLSVEYRQI